MLFLFAASSFAQPDLLSTVGLAHRDATGRDWAYVVWQSPNSSAVAGQTFAVYAKIGPATSTNQYERKAIVARQQDTHVIEPLLQRSVNLVSVDGELGGGIYGELGALEGNIDKLFGSIIPAGTLGVSAKLSAVLRGTTGNDRAYRNLTLLSRIHPGVSLCLGTAAAELFPPGVPILTFEVRQWDAARRMDLAVIGRVTVTAGAPLLLPSPGAPLEFPDATASGNLNIKMRWPMTDTLRRLGMAMHGFNVWRVTKTYAEAQNFHITPPTIAQLLAAPGNVRQRLNETPILAAKYFTAANVGDFSTNGDPKTFFFTDDNKFFLPGNVRFADGEAFYYFVTARDLLGRDGQPSPGLLARACDRIPPQAPRRLRIMSVHGYNGGQGSEGLKLSWYPPPGPPVNYAYHVYRYDSRQELQTLGHLPGTNRIAGPLTFAPGTAPFTYIDRPCTNGNSNTFWYVVRATELTACGTNISPPSAAAFGTCRDWSGPSGATGIVYTVCFRPEVVCAGSTTVNDPGPPHPGKCHIRLVCNSDSRLIQWAEFYQGNSTNPIARHYFSAKATNVVQELYLPNGPQYQFYCRVGTADGAEDVSGPCSIGDCSENLLNIVTFKARVIRSVIIGEPNVADGCYSHFRQLPYPSTPAGSGVATNDGVTLTLNLPPGTKEYRLYRSVDGGPKGLVSQGTNATNTVTVTDNALPINSCTICYYSQPFDENGNPGPLTRLDPCVPVAGVLPAPQQLPIAGGALTLAGSIMNISWFCPSPGVDHFEVWISDASGIVSPNLTLVPQIIPIFAYAPFGSPASPSVAAPLSEYTIYRTPRISAAFGSNDLFSVLATTTSGHEHKILIRAVDIHGNTGPLSNEEEFRTSLKRFTLLPQVSWPAREMPLSTNRIFTPTIQPVNVNTPCFDGIGIRIGTARIESAGSCSNIQLIAQSVAIASDRFNSNFMPVVLYRQQVANFFFPNVSGDVAQVSPLIEHISFDAVPGGNYSYLDDPFFVMSFPGGQGQQWDIVLKDTQPVVVGARYRYAFVRFQENHELEEVIPLGEVEVTP